MINEIMTSQLQHHSARIYKGLSLCGRQTSISTFCINSGFYWPFGRVIVPSLKLHYITVHNGKLGWVFERCLQILLTVNRESKWTHLNRAMLIQQLTCFWDLVDMWDMLKNELSTAWCKRKKKYPDNCTAFFVYQDIFLRRVVKKVDWDLAVCVRFVACPFLQPPITFCQFWPQKGTHIFIIQKQRRPSKWDLKIAKQNIHIFLESNLARQ